MFPPDIIFNQMLETWDGSSRTLFKNFLATNSGIAKWMISADYCLRDSTRANDCYAFSIIPYRESFSDLTHSIRAALPKDIKKARYLSQAGVDLLMETHIFHIAIVVPKDRDIFNNGPASNPLEISREVAQITFDQAREMERGDAALQPLRKMVEAARAKRFNYELYGDLLLLGFFFPFVSLLLNRERKAEIIGWISDRDNMTTWGDGVVWNNAIENFRGLGELSQIDVEGTRVCIAVPDQQSGPTWLDELIRLPDYFAGTIAAWNAPANELSDQPKSLLFVQMLEHVFANAPNSVILKLDIGGAGLCWRRLEIRLNDGHTRVPLGPQPDLLSTE